MVHTRGHGLSDKPHEVDRYHGDVHARDVSAVLDALDVDAFDVVGYSMGAIARGLAPRARGRVAGGGAVGNGTTAVQAPTTATQWRERWRRLGIARDQRLVVHPEFKPQRAQAGALIPSHDFEAISAKRFSGYKLHR